MSYTISINISTDASYTNVEAVYTGNDTTTIHYQLLPTVASYATWRKCSNPYMFDTFIYLCNGAIYFVSPISTYLTNATASCPNGITISSTNELLYGVSMYAYTSVCNSSSNSFQGKYLDTSVNMNYDINTNVVSNVSCNTDINAVSINSGPSYSTSYNFYNNSILVLTIRVDFTNVSANWEATGITITNHSASTAQTIVAIAFLSNMFYNLSYYTKSKNKNSSTTAAYLILFNSLTPTIQVFNNLL